ncbi:MAG: sigma-70 family RNA polymerase sigma factor [Bacteroidota bacterium]
MISATAPCSSEQEDKQVIDFYLQLQAQECFRLLYDRYAAKIYSKAITMLKNERDAENATQEIFTKIFLNLSKFSGNSKFSTWVYSVTYNYCIDFIRRNKRKQKLFADEIENPPDLVDDGSLDQDLLQMKVHQLKVVLEELSDGDRTILLMKYQDDMQIKEIANIIGKRESAVKMQLKRAKEKAKKIFLHRFPPETE